MTKIETVERKDKIGLKGHILIHNNRSEEGPKTTGLSCNIRAPSSAWCNLETGVLKFLIDETLITNYFKFIII